MSHALADHPNFWLSHQSDFLIPFCACDPIKWAHQSSWEHPASGCERRCMISYEEFAAYIGHGFDQLFLSRSGGKRWIDQTPTCTMIVDQLAPMFPRARFIHIARDGRSVVNSMIHSGFDTLNMNISWASDFAQACKSWVSHVNAARTFQQSFPGRYLEVRYEQLSTDPATTFHTVFDFLDTVYASKSAHYINTVRINSSYAGGLGSVVEKEESTKWATGDQLWDQWTSPMRKCFTDEAGESMNQKGYRFGATAGR